MDNFKYSNKEIFKWVLIQAELKIGAKMNLLKFRNGKTWKKELNK
jgi:hypothetical protein